MLIGWTASGKTDLFSTPLHVACPGVVIHGTIFNAIVTGNLWTTLPAWWTSATALVFGLLTTAAVTWLSPWKSLGTSAVMGGGYLAVNTAVLFDRHHMIMGLVAPLLAIGGVWSLCSLVRFIKESSERAWIVSQFSSYVDPSLVCYLMEHPEEAGFEGEEKELTVVFTDLAGFTTLSELLKRRAVPVLNDYLSRMEPVIRKHHGLLNKFLGDGIMFFFGAPAPYPGEKKGHAKAAVRAVLEMQGKVDEFNQTLVSRGLPKLKMRAGISTGEMIVGNAGTPARSDYTVLGDRVNFASRLESANKATGTLVLMSERTTELAEETYLVRKIGKLQVVGKQESEMTYEPLALLESATPEQRCLAKQTNAMVDAYVKGNFEQCLREVEKVSAAGGDASKTLCELYQGLCEEYLKNPPKLFSGQIRLEHK